MSEVITVPWPARADTPASARQVEADPTPVPGLVIHASLPYSDGTPGEGWTLTHAPSGFAVGWFPEGDPETALACAMEIAPMADWSATVVDVPAIRWQVVPVLLRWGAELYRSSISYDEWKASAGG